MDNTKQAVQIMNDAFDKLKVKMEAQRNNESYKQQKYDRNKKMYEYLDKFISETPPSDNIHEFQISCRDLRDGKKMYNKMRNDPFPNYEIFGSNGGGYTCFGLYKSKDQKMYVIVVDIQTPTDYVIIENENCFGN
jgi:hypothetical protein